MGGRAVVAAGDGREVLSSTTWPGLGRCVEGGELLR